MTEPNTERLIGEADGRKLVRLAVCTLECHLEGSEPPELEAFYPDIAAPSSFSERRGVFVT